MPYRTLDTSWIKVPIFSKPKLQKDYPPLSLRLGRNLPGMWMTGCAPKCRTEHRHHPFITCCEPFEPAHRANQRNYWNQQVRPTDGTDQEEDDANECENDISTDEIDKTDP